MKNLNQKIDSSALGFSIIFILLIGLFTTGLIFISGANKRIETFFLGKEKMLINNQSSAHYFANQSELLQEKLVHSSGDTTSLVQKSWAGFKVINSKTYHHGKNVNRSFIYGVVPEEKLPTLYLAEKNQKLSIGGDTKIEGWIKTPKRGIARASISGKPFKGSKLYSGKMELSDKSLPKLKSNLFDLKASKFYQIPRLEKLPMDTTFSFDLETHFYTSTSTVELDGFLHGNVIIHSLEKVIIDAQADLDNVLIIAPKVEINENFSGRIHVIAHNRIDCAENVQLLYPSTLILNEIVKSSNSQTNGIYIGPNSMVLGGVGLISSAPNFRNPLLLDIDQSLIAGLVYSTGETQLKGKVYGSLMTSKFTLNTGGGVYGNHLLDATISDKIPEDFVFPDWLGDAKIMSAKLIECL